MLRRLIDSVLDHVNVVRLHWAIRDLGPTRESALATLRKYKVRTPKNPSALRDCLIATYLKRRRIPFKSVAVTSVYMRPAERRGYSSRDRVPLPDHVQDLINDWCFDALPEFTEK